MDFESFTNSINNFTAPVQSLNERKQPGEELNIGNERIITHTGKRFFYDLKDVKNASDHLGQLPKTGETIHLIMPGNYAAFDLTIALVKLIKAKIKELTISTLGYNKSNITHLFKMLDSGQVEKMNLLASEVFKEKDKPITNYTLGLAEKTDRVKVAFTRNHSKIQIFDLDQKSYVTETSSNLRSCNAIEQATITQSNELADFHRKWIKELINRYQ